jgi:predicted transcriptional regulator of viral defense system
MFGVTTVWRGQTRVQVSDTSRTITDVLDTPRLGGGIRHVTEALSVYFSGEHRNDELLTDYIDRLGNRTIPKRLGYLVEALGIPAPKVIDFCQANASTGYSKLDPAVSASGRLVRRWNLEINVRVTDRARA